MRHHYVASLDEHPNRDEIEAVLTRLPQLTDPELDRLAAVWENTERTVAARARAMSPDTPLVLDALGAIETTEYLYLPAGEGGWADRSLGARGHAVQAIRDAIAAAYARPVLGWRGHRELMRAWRSAIGREEPGPLLGPCTRRVLAVLDVVSLVATDCHNPVAARLFDELDLHADTLDREATEAARADAAAAAEITGRQRTARFVLRVVGGRLPGRCRVCGARPDPRRYEPVVRLCADAAVALLVSDVLDEQALDVLVAPLRPALAGSGGPVGEPRLDR